MGLINLLTVGRSLSGVSHGAGHYKLAHGNLLPNFSAGRAASRGAAAVIAPVKQPEPAPQKTAVASAPPARDGTQRESQLTPAAPAPASAAEAVAAKSVHAPTTAPAGEKSKFTLGRWVGLLLNR